MTAETLPATVTPLAFVVAVARNGVMGRDNALPWHLPGELRYFKERTLGRPLLMGRKTFASIGRPLPGRTNIVVTRDRGFAAEGIEVVHSLAAGLTLADTVAQRDGADAIMAIGGAQLFAQLFDRVDVIHYTRVEADVEGDVRFPAWQPSQWHCRTVAEHPATAAAPGWTVFEFRRRAG